MPTRERCQEGRRAREATLAARRKPAKGKIRRAEGQQQRGRLVVAALQSLQALQAMRCKAGWPGWLQPGNDATRRPGPAAVSPFPGGPQRGLSAALAHFQALSGESVLPHGLPKQDEKPFGLGPSSRRSPSQPYPCPASRSAASASAGAAIRCHRVNRWRTWPRSPALVLPSQGRGVGCQWLSGVPRVMARAIVAGCGQGPPPASHGHGLAAIHRMPTPSPSWQAVAACPPGRLLATEALGSVCLPLALSAWC
jgi:hypothetical protein